MNKREQQAFEREYMAMHRALQLLGFDVPKLIDFLVREAEPVFCELTLGYVSMQVDERAVTERAQLSQAAIRAVADRFQRLRAYDADAIPAYSNATRAYHAPTESQQ